MILLNAFIFVTIIEKGSQLSRAYLPILSTPPVLTSCIFSLCHLYDKYNLGILNEIYISFLWFLVVEKNVSIDKGKAQFKQNPPLQRLQILKKYQF